MSLPGACLAYVSQSKVHRLLAKSQFGIGVQAGPETMIAITSALCKLCPDDIFLALDLVNAFGEISRATILEEVLEFLHELAPFLISLWGENGTPMFVANGQASWSLLHLVDGLFQGHNLSSILFCLGLRRVLRTFEQRCALVLDSSQLLVHL